MFFEQKVNKRSRQSMTAFLANHFRYNTMNSWNGSSSYAHNVKLHRLGLSPGHLDKAYEVIFANENHWDRLSQEIDDFTHEHDGRFTIGSNGRSSGYLVLYRSSYESTGYKSFCPCCGQRNFKLVPPNYTAGSNEQVIASEILRSGGAWVTAVYLTQPAIQIIRESDEWKLSAIERLKRELKDTSQNTKCGVCGNERKNYAISPVKLTVMAGQGLGMDEMADWSMDDLRYEVNLVQSFDRTCDNIRDDFINLLETCDVVEETIMVPKSFTKLECRS